MASLQRLSLALAKVGSVAPRPPLATASTVFVASRLLHSKSLYGRGRSAIKANGPQRRKSPSRSDPTKEKNAKQQADANPWKSSWSIFSPQSEQGAQERFQAEEQTRHERLREASEKWPSWLPRKPVELQQWEWDQEAAKHRAAEGAKGPTINECRRRTASTSPEEVEGVFIRKDDPRHSQRGDTSQDYGWQQTTQSPFSPRQQEWPSWLGPRPQTPPRHPVFSLLKPSAVTERRAFWERYKTIIIVVLGGGGIYYVYHLEQVPYTGRWRFKDVSETAEERMGQDAFAETMAQYRGKVLHPSHPYSKMARQVATRLLGAAADLHGLGFDGVVAGSNDVDPNDKTYARPSVRNTQWQVFVIDDPKAKNAFVLPGGQIFIFTGILPYCKDQDGLAAVMSHEISHKLCSHSSEKVSGARIFLGLGLLIDVVIGAFGIGNIFTQYLLALPNSRKLEQEADALGLKLMGRACFNPEAAPELWKRMDQGEEGGWLGEIISTHPLSAKRMENLKKLVPAAQEIRQDAGCPPAATTDGFQRAASRLRFA